MGNYERAHLRRAGATVFGEMMKAEPKETLKAER